MKASHGSTLNAAPFEKTFFRQSISLQYPICLGSSEICLFPQAFTMKYATLSERRSHLASTNPQTLRTNPNGSAYLSYPYSTPTFRPSSDSSPHHSASSDVLLTIPLSPNKDSFDHKEVLSLLDTSKTLCSLRSLSHPFLYEPS